MDSIREYQFGLQLLGKSIFQIQVLLWWRHHLHRFQVHLDLFLKVATKLSIVGAVLYSIDFWYTEKSDPLVWWQWHMRTRHYRLLCDNRHLILIEPYLLNVSLVRSASIQNKTKQQIGKEQDDLRWRFNLTDGLFRWDNQSLTVAMFADRFKQQKLDLGRFEKSFSVFGPAGPYDQSNTSVLHVFYEWKQSWWDGLLEGLLSIPPVQLHLVVMYKVDHFVWIGQISNLSFRSHHFGQYQQIYDPFEGSSHDGVSLPDDVQHFLSQMSTDRYVHCPTERTTKWFEGNNLTIDSTKTRASESAIVAMKGLMRTMQMHFWIASGTLLGWFRQCHITPYDTDTDFGTWIKYGYTTNLTTNLMNNVPAHNLTLYHRFGDATSQTLEYSFLSYEPIQEKVDLFFVVPNGTHFRMALHFVPYYTYLVYPQYDLCSVALLGHKLLAPCTPEQVVQTEYGPNWSKPVSDWNYIQSSANTDPAIWWKFNSSQMEFF